eukprot:CAMPEP_0172478682 /NCGR_PEP_ID=MMETSP1066-20121228/2782_1 /TAXON_ID=671091 /ORGANISM="Coscinodiscus wailesii, Strain CCMP2513" /LENGTH=154 /DNA_ID=CAMNT_0013238473 /DNA_START=176 /DNA_END=637 /DNA_ORIENTATION=-
MTATRPTGIIERWRNDAKGTWTCYWDRSYGMPSDRHANFVFRPDLVMSRCGVIRRAGNDTWRGEAGTKDYLTEEEEAAIHDVLKMYEDARDESDGTDILIGRGDEGNGVWYPIAVRWSSGGGGGGGADGGDLTPKNLLVRLGAHDELLKSVCAW